jgi:hypothetical protein
MKNNGFVVLTILLGSGLFSLVALAQNKNNGGWLDPVYSQTETVPAENQKAVSGPAPRYDISGLWATSNGVQASGVLAMPNDGRPQHQLPYTPYGLKAYQSHKALEGFDSVPPGHENDPRVLCEPLGFPRANHYNVRLTQIFQDDDKVAILYQYDNRWRFIWTDGRALPTMVEGGVKTGNIFREPRFYGFSVGKWTDDTTLVVETVGMMPEDRVWLDSTGRPISDQLKVTETYHRLDGTTMELSETVDDPKMYMKPWVTLNKMRMHLGDPHTDVQESGCSPVEQQKYDQIIGAGEEFETPKK